MFLSVVLCLLSTSNALPLREYMTLCQTFLRKASFSARQLLPGMQLLSQNLLLLNHVTLSVHHVCTSFSHSSSFFFTHVFLWFLLVTPLMSFPEEEDWRRSPERVFPCLSFKRRSVWGMKWRLIFLPLSFHPHLFHALLLYISQRRFPASPCIPFLFDCTSFAKLFIFLPFSSCTVSTVFLHCFSTVPSLCSFAL